MARCEGRTGTEAGAFGFTQTRCKTERGVRTWHDEAGREHAACAAHWSGLEHLYPMAPPVVLTDDGTVVEFPTVIGSTWLTFPDPIDLYKAEIDREGSWTA